MHSPVYVTTLVRVPSSARFAMTKGQPKGGCKKRIILTYDRSGNYSFRKIRVRWLLSHWGVTRFGDVSSLWQYKSSTNFWRFLSHLPKCWAYFGIFWHSWTNFHCCKWPNIKNNPTIWSHWLRSSIDIMFFINISLKLSLFFGCLDRSFLYSLHRLSIKCKKHISSKMPIYFLNMQFSEISYPLWIVKGSFRPDALHDAQ